MLLNNDWIINLYDGYVMDTDDPRIIKLETAAKENCVCALDGDALESCWRTWWR